MLTPALQALVEPRRRQILELIQDAELTSGEIASHFRITRPAISQHLGVLSRAGLVRVRRRGTRRLYRIRPEGFSDLHAYLKQFWHEGLLALKREAEKEEKRGRSHGRKRSRRGGNRDLD